MSPENDVMPSEARPDAGASPHGGARTTSAPDVRYRRLGALVAGVTLAAAFPKIGVAGLAWVAPGLMLLAAIDVNGRGAFRLGYIAGLVHHLISLSWLLHIPVFKLAPISGWLALSSFLALFPAAWVWLCWRSFPGNARSGAFSSPGVAGHEDRPTSAGPFPPGHGRVQDRFLEISWARRVIWALTCAALWVAWEMIQARLFSGFPWNLLGSSQFRMLPMIQIASVVGIYGVSFLAVWFSVSLLMAGIVVLRRSRAPRRWMWEMVLPLLVLAAVLASGYRSVLQQMASAPGRRTVRLALIQPNIPQRMIWSHDDSALRFTQLIDLSRQAMEKKPDIIVWPEAAVPGFVRWDTNTHAALTGLARSNRVWLIVGADDAEPREAFSDQADIFNASFLVSPEGQFVSRYAKRKLVMFGEYIPFARWLPFIERWTGMGSFTPGERPTPFVLPPLGLKTSVLICFEDTFPHVSREYVEEDTDFLLNLTNNGWFGEAAAQWQHAAAAVFRAVENGRPLVRCANNGLTCWVDPSGRLHNIYFEGTSDIYTRGIKVADVPLRGERRPTLTFYTRHGDVFGWTCVGLSAILVAPILRTSRSRKVTDRQARPSSTG